MSAPTRAHAGAFTRSLAGCPWRGSRTGLHSIPFACATPTGSLLAVLMMHHMQDDHHVVHVQLAACCHPYYLQGRAGPGRGPVEVGLRQRPERGRRRAGTLVRVRAPVVLTRRDREKTETEPLRTRINLINSTRGTRAHPERVRRDIARTWGYGRWTAMPMDRSVRRSISKISKSG